MIRTKYRVEPIFKEGKEFVGGSYQVFDCYSGIYLGGIAITTDKKLVTEAADFGGTGETAMMAMRPWVADGNDSAVASRHGYRADLVAEHQIYRPYLKTLPLMERAWRFLWRFGDLAFVVTAAVVAAAVSARLAPSPPPS